MRAYCRRCLIAQVDDEQLAASVRRLVDDLGEEERVEPEVYERRLGRCRECDMLLNGMCRLCGCYVELRCAMRVRSCPQVPPRWEPVRE